VVEVAILYGNTHILL